MNFFKQMNNGVPIFILLLLYSCSPPANKSDLVSDLNEIKKVIQPQFQTLLDSNLLDGAILIFDHHAQIYYSNDFKWSKRGFLPASTFKIPNSIIALETGVVENENTLLLWDGNDHWLDIWEQDLQFKQAFHYSCVPCYQEIARKVGRTRMEEYLSRLDFGEIVVDSIDHFWLQGQSRISPEQQIDFLKRLYFSELEISSRTDSILKNMIVIEEKNGYRLSGKTGWSVQGGENNGWFVGYLEKEEQLFFLATNVSPKSEFDMEGFANIRLKITMEALGKIRELH